MRVAPAFHVRLRFKNHDAESKLNDFFCGFLALIPHSRLPTSRYALFTCSTAKKAAMGSVLRGKQNNLRISALRPGLLAWTEFCSQVSEFLLAHRSVKTT
jgi:hypothetical protein